MGVVDSLTRRPRRRRLPAALQAASTASVQIRPAHLLMALLTPKRRYRRTATGAVGVGRHRPRRNPAPARPFAAGDWNQHAARSCPTSRWRRSPPRSSWPTELDDEYVSTEHVMVGLATGDSDVAKH